jgi:hypothetical protein
MSKRNLNEKVLINNKLRKFNASNATIKAFEKEVDKIIQSGYQVFRRLQKFKNNIT